MCLLPVVLRSTRLTYRWWNDFAFARKEKQESRATAALLLISVGLGTTCALLWNGFGGIISGTVPPSGGSVSLLSATVAVMLILGQISIIVMLEFVNHFYNKLLAPSKNRQLKEEEAKGGSTATKE